MLIFNDEENLVSIFLVIYPFRHNNGQIITLLSQSNTRSQRA